VVLIRKGLGIGRGKGYYNLQYRDPYIHSLSAKGVKFYHKPIYLKGDALKKNREFIKKMKIPHIFVLSPEEFDKKFAQQVKKQHKGETKDWVGFAKTIIQPNGNVKIYVKESDEYEEEESIKHELYELKIWKELVNKGLNPTTAQKVAHNLNPIRDSGYDFYI